MSIFDTKAKRQQTALYAALDAAAPDRGRWCAGLDAFNDAAPNSTLTKALEMALDAAAPDQGTWLDGQAAFAACCKTNTRLMALTSRVLVFRANQFPSGHKVTATRSPSERKTR